MRAKHFLCVLTTTKSRAKINAFNTPVAWAAVRSKAAVQIKKNVNSLFNVPPIACGGSVFGPCIVMQYLVSFLVFAIILTRKRKLVALL